MSQRAKSDDELVSFAAVSENDGRYITLVVECREGLTDHEYADALIAFATEIHTGKFKFDDCIHFGPTITNDH